MIDCSWLSPCLAIGTGFNPITFNQNTQLLAGVSIKAYREEWAGGQSEKELNGLESKEL
jgi:hypothetical protein